MSEAWDRLAKELDEDDLKELILTDHKETGFGAAKFKELDELDLELVLDFGCGLGRNFPSLKEVSKRVHGYDLKCMVDRCEELCETRVDLLTSDWSLIQSHKYDFVVCVLVLQHIYDLKAFHKILRDLSRITENVYVDTRSYIDFHPLIVTETPPNLMEEVLKNGHFIVVATTMPLNQCLEANYKEEQHYSFTMKSRSV